TTDGSKPSTRRIFLGNEITLANRSGISRFILGERTETTSPESGGAAPSSTWAEQTRPRHNPPAQRIMHKPRGTVKRRILAPRLRSFEFVGSPPGRRRRSNFCWPDFR